MFASLLLLPTMTLAVPAPAPAAVGPSLNQAAVGLAGLALAAKIAEDECDDVGVGSSYIIEFFIVLIQINIGIIIKIIIVILQIISDIIPLPSVI